MFQSTFFGQSTFLVALSCILHRTKQMSAQNRGVEKHRSLLSTHELGKLVKPSTGKKLCFSPRLLFGPL